MRTLLIGLFKLLLPWVKEWWKAKDFTPRSQRALREIHVMFFMHVTLFLFFMMSIEHGVSVYVRHAEHLRATQHDVRLLADREEQIVQLKEHNKYLSNSYLALLGVVDKFARENPEEFERKFNLAPIAELRRGVVNHDDR